jgi:hypothetical protein
MKFYLNYTKQRVQMNLVHEIKIRGATRDDKGSLERVLRMGIPIRVTGSGQNYRLNRVIY